MRASPSHHQARAVFALGVLGRFGWERISDHGTRRGWKASQKRATVSWGHKRRQIYRNMQLNLIKNDVLAEKLRHCSRCRQPHRITVIIIMIMILESLAREI